MITVREMSHDVLRTIKKPHIYADFHIWRRNGDLNPGTVLPIYELSKPAPSTAWVFLRLLNYLIILF